MLHYAAAAGDGSSQKLTFVGLLEFGLRWEVRHGSVSLVVEGKAVVARLELEEGRRKVKRIQMKSNQQRGVTFIYRSPSRGSPPKATHDRRATARHSGHQGLRVPSGSRDALQGNHDIRLAQTRRPCVDFH